MLVLGPVMHAAGQWNALSMLLSGSTVVLNTDRVFSPPGPWNSPTAKK